MRDSLRWRLPLSYAAIALLTTTALGVVLLLTLRSIYRQQELAYLGGNAATIAEEVSGLMADGKRPFLQTQIDGFAFLVQAHVEILDAEKQLVAASGLSDIINPTISINPGSAFPDSSFLPELDNFNEEDVVIVVEEQRQVENGVITSEKVVTRTSNIPARDTLYGFSLDGSQTEIIERSNLQVEAPILDNEAQLVGYVRLSQGPAYGRSILRSVAVGWVVAGIVAVLIAALVGWFAARRLIQPLLALTGTTTRMAEGDLTVRTNMQRADELGQLGNAFNRMAQRVETTVTTLRHFVADAAHELNTPLTALHTNLELARQHTTDPQQTTRLARAQAQTTRLQALTDSLLSLSKIEAAENGMAHTPVNLTQLVRQIGEIYASRAEQHNIRFDIVVGETAVHVNGSAPQLRQAVRNLLDNALKFTPPDGKVTLSLTADGQQATVQVTDTGIGIPEADMAGLFGRFHRGRNVGDIPGNGLGLAIVKAIVERHGGEIMATSTSLSTDVSTPNNTRFTLTLPQK
ncbi:MAG: HAMP domain-containing histidine kinase [Anaerolineales bacterium]|nr:HAMP domain-containing histidine kinase [Anaerolineales bacterium]